MPESKDEERPLSFASAPLNGRDENWGRAVNLNDRLVPRRRHPGYEFLGRDEGGSRRPVFLRGHLGYELLGGHPAKHRRLSMASVGTCR